MSGVRWKAKNNDFVFFLQSCKIGMCNVNCVHRELEVGNLLVEVRLLS